MKRETIRNSIYPRILPQFCIILTLFSGLTFAEPKDAEALGYSVKGDKESPNVLYFTPWQSPRPPSKIAVPFSGLNSLQAIDRDTLLREQRYFKLLQTQSKSTPKK